jgi:hypothetical protein
MVHGGKFVFIRFNPDKYINRHNTKVNPYMKKRMARLSEEIIYQSNRIVEDHNDQLVDIVYLFYDKFD